MRKGGDRFDLLRILDELKIKSICYSYAPIFKRVSFMLTYRLIGNETSLFAAGFDE